MYTLTEHKEIMMLTPMNDKRPSLPQKLGKTLEKDIKEKKKLSFPVTTGTFFFLIACLLLIAGMCRFSFYVLKNHRSALDRDDFVKTYVDVQPYAGKRRSSAPSYIALNTEQPEVPAIFYAPAGEEIASASEKRPSGNAASLLIAEKAPAPLFTPAERLAPVPNQPLQVAAFQRPPVIRFEKEVAPVEIDELITSGTALLNQADEAILSTAKTLEFEEAEAETETAVPLSMTSKTLDTRQEIASVEQVSKSLKAEESSVQEKETHWVDIAALRRLIDKTPKEGTVRKETNDNILQANASLLQMGARQVAELKEGVSSDTEIHKAAKTTVVQDIPFSGTEPKTAVVQDIPFSGTEPKKVASNTKKEEEKAPKKQKKSVFDNNFAPDNPWKVATVNGKASNPMAVIEKQKPSQEAIMAIKNLAKEKESLQEEAQEYIEVNNETPMGNQGQAVIYRNGRVHKVYQMNEEEADTSKSGKPLSWMERQQAAVWTNMSQSDTPSVWSVSSNEIPHNPEAAKAFKVVDVPDEPSSISTSAPVRIVAEENKPEAVKDPLLLPLGAPDTATAVPTSQYNASAAPQTAPSTFSLGTGVQPATLPQTALTETAKAAAPPATGEEGLVNKIFSLFGRSDTSATLPSIGSGAPPASAGAKSEEQKKETKDTKTSAKTTETKKENIRDIARARKKDDSLLPTELRLTFKPGTSEISTQSVKWIKAFGQRAKKDIQSAVEVRMSNQETGIQEKRFALIRSALVGAGMEDAQIIPVVTNRTPHTIVLRLFDMPEEGYEEYTSSGSGVEERLYYRQW